MTGSVTDRLEKIYTGVLYDVMRAAGLRPGVLPPTIRPVGAMQRLVGPVFTVSGHLEEGLDAHETLLAWTGFLTEAAPDHVVVCQPNDSTIAHMGELSAETLQIRGVRGYIVDGGCRDTEFIEQIGFPVWCRYNTPADVAGRWMPDAYQEPIEIGGVTVRQGDYVVADHDGVLTVPRDRVEEVIAAAEEAMGQESLVREAIREGTPPRDAYLAYGKF